MLVPGWKLTVLPVRNVASFFGKMTAEQLWKSVTTISSAGRKGGRAKYMRRAKDLNRGQIIGQGLINTKFKGLNAPLDTRTTGPVTPLEITSPNLDYYERLQQIRQVTHKKRPDNPHPLLRGWSGRSPQGQHFGPPPPVGDEKFEGFDSICLESKFVCHMTGTIGRTRRRSVLMVVGNKNGLAGYALSKSPTGHTALNSALASAGRKLQYIERLDNRTIYQDFWAECGRSRLFVQRAAEGAGLNCHRAIASICKMIGIKDIYVKIDDASSNTQAITKAFFKGLGNQETYQQLADRKRLHVVEFSRSMGYRPIVKASPKNAPVRTEDEIKPGEILDVEEMYGAGRHPWRPKKATPFYKKLDSYKHRVWSNHPFRNQRKVAIRLLAEGIIPSLNVKELVDVGKKWHAEAMTGERVIPRGIGIPDVMRDDIFAPAEEED